MIMIQLKFTAVFALKFIFIHSAISQIVNTTSGLVRGTTLTSREGKEFSAFLGIPYAKPVLENERFLDPRPADSWNGIRNATSYGPICYQYGNFVGIDLPQSEDCLNINVFTPVNQTILDFNEDELLPVLVYLHGGYFMVLSGSSYGPKYLMDHDIVFVTFNYRLGAFGFLSTEDDNAPGNAGMKDQILALQWVQDNIRFFGGSSSKVTIYGESAGGAAVQYHLLSPQSEGLFSAAISGSGTAFKVLSYQVAPSEAAMKLADEVGCGALFGNKSELVQCLRTIDANIIAEKGDEFSKVLKDPLRIYSPSTEVNGTSDKPFLTQHPYQVMASGNQQRVPWMAGVNSGEGFIVTLNILGSENMIEEINANWTDGLAKEFLVLGDGSFNVSNVIDDFYLSTVTTNGSVDFRKDLMGFTDLFTDRLYIHSTLKAVEVQANQSPVFLYYNDYMTASNPTGLGTVHGEELALLFSPGNFSDPIIDKNHHDYEQSRIMVDLWVQFVKNPYNVTYNNQIWKPVNSSVDMNMDCLILRNSNRGEQGFAGIPDIVKRRVQFWNQLHVPPYQDF